MKNRNLFSSYLGLLLGLLGCNVALAQNEYEWVSTYDGILAGNDFGYSITVDKNDVPYATGYSTGNDNSWDITTHKYDPSDGSILWTKIHKGSTWGGVDIASEIITDDSGYVYVAGSVTNDSTDLDFITIKYDSDGNEIWARSYNYDSNSVDGAQTVLVDDSGNVYVAGLSKHLDSLVIVLKYNSQGDTMWSYKFQGMALGWNETVKIQFIGGELFVAGSSGRGIHLAKLNVINGTEYWSKFHKKGLEPNINDRILDMIVNDSKEMLFTGSYPIKEDSLSLSDEHSYVVAYDSMGNELWFSSYSEESTSWNIDLDSDGNIYVCGTITVPNELSNYLAIKYNSSGEEQWARTYNGSFEGQGVSNDRARRIVVKNGEVFVSGNAVNTIHGNYIVGITTLKYTLSGDLIWISSYHNGSSLMGLAADGQGNAYVTGLDTEKDVFLTLKYGLLTGISDNAGTGSLSIFPNPARGLLHISGIKKSTTKIRIINPIGVNVITKELTGSSNELLDIQTLQNGFYLIQFLDNNNQVIHQSKILKI